MKCTRTTVDLLREEYFKILPRLSKVAHEFEITAKHHLIPITKAITAPEQITFSCRIKDCESAIKKLRDKQEGAIFDDTENYSLLSLKDLVGLRISVFMSDIRLKVDEGMRERFNGWQPDHIGEDPNILCFKYFGRLPGFEEIGLEYQVVPTLIGLYWQVEHSAFYKPASHLVSLKRHPEIEESSAEVCKVLLKFEKLFEEKAKEISKK